MAKSIKRKLNTLLLRYFLNAPPDWLVMLGPPSRKYTPVATIYSEPLWREESWSNKVSALFRRCWQPSEAQIRELSDNVFIADIFGQSEDYGDKLLRLATWHYQQTSSTNDLSKDDEEKANSLQVFT